MHRLRQLFDCLWHSADEIKPADDALQVVSMEPPGSGDPATSALLLVAMLLPFGLIALLRWDYARWERQNPPKKAR